MINGAATPHAARPPSDKKRGSAKPSLSDLHASGLARHGEGKFAEAIEIFNQLLALDPAHIAGAIDLGNSLMQTGRLDEAVSRLEGVLRSAPQSLAANINLGNALTDLKRYGQAASRYRAALALQPDSSVALTNLGNLLWKEGAFRESERAQKRSLRIGGGSAEAHCNLGNVLRDLGRLEEAEDHCRHAIKLRPDYAIAHSNLAMALLMGGKFEEGWREYEWRWKQKSLAKEAERFTSPPWNGEDLAGKTLLVFAEQGAGDTIQFCRLIEKIPCEVRVIFEAPGSLASLMRDIPGVDVLIHCGDEVPPHDYHCGLLSLPRILGTNLSDLSAAVPYLRPANAKIRAWQRRLANVPGLKVGLVWAGQPHMAIDDRRSIPFDQLAPLFEVPAVTFVSLQVGQHAFAGPMPDRAPFKGDWTKEFQDFEDTAALLKNLDLVISVDTAVAHLAGALGRPVWLLNRFDRCWRWLHGRTDSPWYPSMRLYNQPEPGDWASVIARARDDLHDLAFDVLSRKGVDGIGVDRLLALARYFNLRSQAEKTDIIIRKILSVRPDEAAAFDSLGGRAIDDRKWAEAVDFTRIAVALAPGHPHYVENFSTALKIAGRFSEALGVCDRALLIAPHAPSPHHKRGMILEKLSRGAEAEAAYRHSLDRDPAHPGALLDLANRLTVQGRFQESEGLYGRLTRARPLESNAHWNLGVSMYMQGRLEQAIAAFRRALCIAPGSPDIWTALGQAHLLSGQFKKGWTHYEARWMTSNFPSRKIEHRKPIWRGEALKGKTILVCAEQGFGDNLQFCRFITKISAQAKVILEVPSPLIELMTSLSGVARIVPEGKGGGVKFDVYCPMLSLPKALGITLDDITDQKPYLSADPAKRETWRHRLRPIEGRKIGIAWTGSPVTTRNRDRSIDPEELMPLFDIPGLRFVSLQKFQPQTHKADQGYAVPAGMTLLDWTEELNDFSDTAALIAELDLVIAVDTAIVHLAGALGKPIWLLNRYSPCWRWLLGRKDSPWYPSLRQFRQSTLNDWRGVIGEVEEALQTLPSIGEDRRSLEAPRGL